MQLANVMVAIGGDTGNTVGKFGVTASEIAVLTAIHGDGSVFDIEATGSDTRTNRSERERLFSIYGRAVDGNNNSIFNALFPGAAARMFETIAELELPEELFKATSRGDGRQAPVEPARAAPIAQPAPAQAAAPPKPLTAAQKKKAAAEAAKAAKAAKAAAEAPAPEPVVADEDDDGIEDMPDSSKPGVLD